MLQGDSMLPLILEVSINRIYNLYVFSLVSIKELCAFADSVSICTSKGLGAPVGSLLCSDAETIKKAHRVRKALGGGMRQAGIIAAGCKFFDSYIC